MLKFLHERGDIQNFAQPVSVGEHDGSIVVESATQQREHEKYLCPITGWKYFYATLDVDLLDSDDDEVKRSACSRGILS